jgi:hypothetical protein
MPSPNPPRQVLIVETRLEGHHPKWVGMSVVAFRGLGAKVTVAAAEPEALRERAAANLEGAEVDFIPLGTAAHGLPSVRAAANLAKAHEADLCFWPTLDNFASALLRRAAFGGRPPESLKGLLAGVYHRPRPLDARERGFGRALKRAGFARLHREGWWNAIFVLDPGVAADVARDFPGLRCALVPDPHEWPALPARDEARRKLDIPRDALVLLHFGTEARRKGLDLTLDALARSRAADKLFLLRAGQSAPDSPAAARVREL